MARFGLIHKETIEHDLLQVASVHIDQGTLGRWLDFGSITINGSQGSDIPVPMIGNPQGFKRALFELQAEAVFRLIPDETEPAKKESAEPEEAE